MRGMERLERPEHKWSFQRNLLIKLTRTTGTTGTTEIQMGTLI